MTRPPDRIDVVLAELRDYWEDHPDLRLGQIVSTAAQSSGDIDPFYLEDTALDTYLSRMNDRQPLYRVVCEDCGLSVLHVTRPSAEDGKEAHKDRTGHIAHVETVEPHE